MAADASALEELHSELSCPVCLELFREPVILECGHHFCRVCITQCWEAKSDEHPTCPQCRKTCPQKLRPNSLLCNVVDSVRRARSMDLKPGDTERPDLCEEHEEKLKLYCEDDQLAICLVCGMSRAHKTHNVIPINEAFENYKVTLWNNILYLYIYLYRCFAIEIHMG
uniref:Tripartite motif containing 39 n=1 Tax=Hucho hucho TaxID=62062 RepID=A0A4W5PNI5_9TELE